MEDGFSCTKGSHGRLARILLSMEGSPRSRIVLSWFILLIGLFIWIAAQGTLTLVPLWSRALPPEVDDSLSYVLKSRIMEECYQRDCPALVDLKKELHGSDP